MIGITTEGNQVESLLALESSLVVDLDALFLIDSNLCSSHRRGLDCERRLAAYFIKKYPAMKFMAHRLRTPFGELDLVFKSFQKASNETHWILFEVKSLTGSQEFLSTRISQRQKQRLSQSFEFFLTKTNDSVQMHLGVVDQNNRITIFEDFLSDL